MRKEPTTNADAGTPSACAGPRTQPVVAERKAAEVDTDRNPEHLLRVDAAGEHELVHLRVCHLHTVDTRRIAFQRLERAIELGVAGRARPAVEVAEPEPVRRLEPARLQCAEVVVVEDGLPFRKTCPRRRARRRSPSRRAVAVRRVRSSSIDQPNPSPTTKSREASGHDDVRSGT